MFCLLLLGKTCVLCSVSGWFVVVWLSFYGIVTAHLIAGILCVLWYPPLPLMNQATASSFNDLKALFIGSAKQKEINQALAKKDAPAVLFQLSCVLYFWHHAQTKLLLAEYKNSLAEHFPAGGAWEKEGALKRLKSQIDEVSLLSNCLCFAQMLFYDSSWVGQRNRWLKERNSTPFKLSTRNSLTNKKLFSQPRKKATFQRLSSYMLSSCVRIFLINVYVYC